MGLFGLNSLGLLTGIFGTCLSAAAQEASDEGAGILDPLGGRIFAQRCAACHIDPNSQIDAPRVGPSLKGIMGRTAGDLPGFERFSPALINSGIVWSEVELDVYLANPRAYVPGTIMAFAGLSDETERAAVIAYLGTGSQR